LTPYEFALLMKRHRGDVRWQEAMFAVGPWITAEVNRDRKKRKRPWSLGEWTISGLAKGLKKKREPTEDELREKMNAVMKMFGG